MQRGLPRIPIKHSALLGVPRVCLVDRDKLVVIMSVNEHDHGGIFWPGHPVNSIDLHAENVATAGIPGNGSTLPDVAEEVVVRAVGELLDVEGEVSGSIFHISLKRLLSLAGQGASMLLNI